MKRTILMLLLAVSICTAQDSSKVTLSVDKLKAAITANRGRMDAIRRQIADLQKELTQREGYDFGLTSVESDSTLFAVPEKKGKK